MDGYHCDEPPLRSGHGEVTGTASGDRAAITAAYERQSNSLNAWDPMDALIDPRLLADQHGPSFLERQPRTFASAIHYRRRSQILSEQFNSLSQDPLHVGTTEAGPLSFVSPAQVSPALTSPVPSYLPAPVDCTKHKLRIVAKYPKVDSSSTPNHFAPPEHNPYVHWPRGKWSFAASQYFTPLSSPQEPTKNDVEMDDDHETTKVQLQSNLCERLKKKLVGNGVDLNRPDSDKNTNTYVAGGLAFCNRSVPLTTHPDECVPEAPKPEREHANRFTSLTLLQYPPALVQQQTKNQHKWLDKGGHSRNTMFVVTHQIGTDIRYMCLFPRLQKANLEVLNMMQRQHPEFFAKPLVEKALKNQPGTSEDAFISGGVTNTSTMSGRSGINIERRYVYIGNWNFTSMCTLKLSAKLSNGEVVKISSSLKNPRSSPPPKRERIAAAKRARAAVHQTTKAPAAPKQKQPSRSTNRSNVSHGGKELRVYASSTEDNFKGT